MKYLLFSDLSKIERSVFEVSKTVKAAMVYSRKNIKDIEYVLSSFGKYREFLSDKERKKLDGHLKRILAGYGGVGKYIEKKLF